MTERSDRRSDRVDPQHAITAGQRPVDNRSAPESMATRGSVGARASAGGRRLSQDEVSRLGAYLTPRDRAVLSDVQRYGFLTTGQIQQLHFHTYNSPEVQARIARRELQQLRQQGLLEPLHRRIGGLRAGSASYVWRLGLIGDRLLREENAPRARRKEPSLRFLDHRLTVAETVCRLAAASRAGAFELLDAQPEPSTWRSFSSGFGVTEILKPDLFVITAAGEFEDHWFVEIDRATESLPTVLKQCQQYERYRRAGIEQDRAGLFPRVLWLVPDAHRRTRLTAAIGRSRDLDDSLFNVGLQADVAATITQLIKEGGD